MKIPYWIQHADFSSQDYDPVDLAQAKQALLTHDWTAELRLGATLEEAEREWCPAGIGFMGEDGAFFTFALKKMIGLFFTITIRTDAKSWALFR